jgi:hypothetical protein
MRFNVGKRAYHRGGNALGGANPTQPKAVSSSIWSHSEPPDVPPRPPRPRWDRFRTVVEAVSGAEIVRKSCNVRCRPKKNSLHDAHAQAAQGARALAARLRLVRPEHLLGRNQRGAPLRPSGRSRVCAHEVRWGGRGAPSLTRRASVASASTIRNCTPQRRAAIITAGLEDSECVKLLRPGPYSTRAQRAVLGPLLRQ